MNTMVIVSPKKAELTKLMLRSADIPVEYIPHAAMDKDPPISTRVLKKPP